MNTLRRRASLITSFICGAISATRAGIVAMLEPVAATVVAYAWLAESLSAVQVAGGQGRPF